MSQAVRRQGALSRMPRGSSRYDLVVLGGGTGGIVASLIAARAGARVALVERERPGGDCLWTGCVPSKSLLAAADLAHRIRHADTVGLTPCEPEIDFAAVMDHVERAIRRIEPHDSAERLRREGVDVFQAEGRFDSPHALAAGATVLRFRRAIVATGSRPVVPPVDGLAAADPLTTDTIWALRELPRRLVVLGGGPIGCELGQAFARLGARVTIVELADRLLLKEEPRAGSLVAERLRDDGVDVRLGHRAVAAAPGRLTVEGPGGSTDTIAFDHILVAAGRAPRTDGIGLERAGVQVDDRGAVIVDARLRTSAPSIYAAGDVTALLPFTHVAAHHARVAAPNALFGLRRSVDAPLPWVTFTDPEVARVGLSEADARRRWGTRAKVSTVGVLRARPRHHGRTGLRFRHADRRSSRAARRGNRRCPVRRGSDRGTDRLAQPRREDRPRLRDRSRLSHPLRGPGACRRRARHSPLRAASPARPDAHGPGGPTRPRAAARSGLIRMQASLRLPSRGT